MGASWGGGALCFSHKLRRGQSCRNPHSHLPHTPSPITASPTLPGPHPNSKLLGQTGHSSLPHSSRIVWASG